MSSNKLCIIFFFLCFIGALEAAEIDTRAGTSYVDKRTLSEMERRRAEPKISQEFSQGNFLIYDCKQRSFVCVNEPSYLLCKEKRSRGYRERKKVLPCAPLKEFPSQSKCFEKQYKLIHSQSEKSYCQNSKNSKY
jgi:predicted DNA-binding WGR domain protein